MRTRARGSPVAGHREVSSPPAGWAIQSPWQAPEFSGSTCSLSRMLGNDVIGNYLLGGEHALILDLREGVRSGDRVWVRGWKENSGQE